MLLIGKDMAASLHTKHNHKDLHLSDVNHITDATSLPVKAPAATRRAPAGPRKRPPPLPDNPLPVPGFASPAGLESAAGTGRGSALNGSLSSTLAKLDLTAVDLKSVDLRQLEELGQGNGGSVVKVEHVPTGTVMAKKIVLVDAKPSIKKQILRELQIMHDCDSPYIVSSYGAFLAEPNICICMEFMDKGSFDGISKKIGPINIEVVCLLAMSVLEGLTYLYDVHRIMHRDVKPSNILCNSRGQIKLCDFGVSGELINSIAHTFVGTSVYMSPERIQGAEYSVKSDVWSLGVTLIELAIGRFPFSEDSESDDSDLSDAHQETVNKTERQRHRQGTMSIIEVMHQIVREPAPRLTQEAGFPKEAEDFVDACLLKDPKMRRTPKILLSYPWMTIAKKSTFDLRVWTSKF